MNLIERLGLEKCKEIVERHRNLGTHFTEFKYYSVKKDDFFLSQLFIDSICVDDLRAAIADHNKCQHEWNETTSNGDKYRFFVCKHCDRTRNFIPLGEDITDYCSDIRNHIAPTTVVIKR